MTVITEPGIHDMTEVDYFADPVPGGSLSSSGARRILPPSCPAIFHHELVNGRPGKRTFDFGHGAHKYVLGAGADVVVVQTEKDGERVDALDFRTKAAQEHQKAIAAAGHIPLLASEDQRAREMAAALWNHKAAAQLLDPDTGIAEQSLFARDPRYGVWRRGRLDWLRLAVAEDGLVDVVDYKTVASAEPRAVAKSIANYGYHLQGAWYADLVLALGLAERVRFLIVAQEKQPPYLATVVEPNDEALVVGRAKNDHATALYAECRAFDHWPSWSDGVIPVSLPPWASADLPEDVIA